MLPRELSALTTSLYYLINKIGLINMPTTINNSFILLVLFIL